MLPAMGQFHGSHAYIVEKRNKFGKIHNLNLVKATRQFASIVNCCKEMVKK